MPVVRSVFGDEASLLESSVLEIQRQLAPPVKKEKSEDNETIKKISLGSFVEMTSNLILEPWQWHLCERLQKLTHQKGQRLMIHKPPQHGGSVILSQRLPPYMIADDPAIRIKVAGFNIEHVSKKFSRIAKEIVQGSEFRALFDDPNLLVPGRAADEEWSTIARKRVADGQASFKSLGLQTGFVGEGADLLIIDDPYPSPQAANSKAIREATWLFWTGSAKVRINSDTNVVMMFHRYREDDIAGQMIADEGLQSQGGIWELLSYRALWDGDERPEVGGPDPLGREIGEYLSPRISVSFYKEREVRNPDIWLAQFQGKPSKAEGNFFKVSQFKIAPKCGVKLIKVCRAWDIASTPDGDWTVGVLMGLGEDERIYVLDVKRFRATSDERDDEIRQTAKLDYMRYRDLLTIRMPQDPGSAGKDMSLQYKKLLKGYPIKVERVNGDKEVRANPYSSYVNAGLVTLVYKPTEDDPIGWVKDYIDELRKFTKSSIDDQVDASSDAFAEVALEVDMGTGEDFDTMGFGLDDDSEDVVIRTEDKESLEILEEYLAALADKEAKDEEGVIDYGGNDIILPPVVQVPDLPQDEFSERGITGYGKRHQRQQRFSRESGPTKDAVPLAVRRFRVERSNKHRQA